MLVVDRRADELVEVSRRLQQKQSFWAWAALRRRQDQLRRELQDAYDSLNNLARGWVFLLPNQVRS